MGSTLCHVTRPHDHVYAIITRSRFGHKLPINSQKVGDKSVQKLLKSCYFIFKVAESCWIVAFFFYLFALEVGFIAVFTSRIPLYFSFS